MTLDETTIERLAFNKYLVNVASEQVNEPQPMAAAAVLTLHDAVELFLQHAAEHLDAESAGNSDFTFMEYWEVISDQLPADERLGQKPAMRRLNDARGTLKHSGTRPDPSDIASFDVTVRDFFEENVNKVFGVRFDSISMVYLVDYESTRDILQEVEDLLKEDRNNDAVQKLAIAYDDLFFEYNQRMRDEFGYKPFSIDSTRGFSPSKRDMRRNYGREMERFFERVNETIDGVEKAIRVLSLGMDFRRYSRFDSLTPTVLRTMDGGYEAPEIPDDTEITDEDAEFCFDFVVETAINLQKRDISVEE